MSRVYTTTQGAPFCKVVSTQRGNGWVMETLSCGHESSHMKSDWSPATKRRCYVCKSKKLREGKKQNESCGN